MNKFLMIFLPIVLLFSPLVMAQQAPRESPLTNEEVVQLCKLDLGDEVVIAKINQAKSVEFKLDTGDLAKLKGEGVSKPVIAAMLNRATAPKLAAGVANGLLPGAASADDEGVFLRIGGKEIRLQSVQGDLSSAWAYFVTLTFLDFPGLKAELRNADRKPTLVIHSSKSPRGRIFFVKCESNKKDNNRSVKIGRAGFASMKSWASPDSDWTVEFDTKEVSGNYWEIIPKKDLEPGEYGLLYRGGFTGLLGAGQGELFDFGVD